MNRLDLIVDAPVAYVTGYHNGRCVIAPLNPALLMPSGIALYIAPPRKEWVGLTEDERFKIATEMGALNADWIEFAFEIEKHVRLKNT